MFQLGNHDRSRVAARVGTLYVDALNTLLLTLPGTPTTYYGEELGMTDIDVSYEDTQDPYGRNLGPVYIVFDICVKVNVMHCTVFYWLSIA